MHCEVCQNLYSQLSTIHNFTICKPRLSKIIEGIIKHDNIHSHIQISLHTPFVVVICSFRSIREFVPVCVYSHLITANQRPRSTCRSFTRQRAQVQSVSNNSRSECELASIPTHLLKIWRNDLRITFDHHLLPRPRESVVLTIDDKLKFMERKSDFYYAKHNERTIASVTCN